jgi:hypothetical protein
VLEIVYHRKIKFFENSLLFFIGQKTDRLVLDIPLTPFIVRRVIPEPIGIPADLIELPGPEADGDVVDVALQRKCE